MSGGASSQADENARASVTREKESEEVQQQDSQDANTNSQAEASASSSSSSQPSSSSQSQSQQAAVSQCAACHKPQSSEESKPLKPCSKCQSVLYCNKECAKADFKSHKKVCASLAQAHFANKDVKMESSRGNIRERRDRGLQKWQFDT